MAILSALPTALYPLTPTPYLDVTKHNPGEKVGSPEFWWRIFLSACLVLLGGVFSGWADFDNFFFVTLVAQRRTC
jgi:hypothetical protein